LSKTNLHLSVTFLTLFTAIRALAIRNEVSWARFDHKICDAVAAASLRGAIC